MKCDLCDEQANVYFTQIVNGQTIKVNLCTQCANEKGIDDPTGFALADILLNFPGIPSPAASSSDPSPSEVECSNCGFKLSTFRETSRLGCSQCFETFRIEIVKLLPQMHKGVQHQGKIPATISLINAARQQLSELQNQLEQAVSAERFEEAVTLRDQIRNLMRHLTPRSRETVAPVAEVTKKKTSRKKKS